MQTIEKKQIIDLEKIKVSQLPEFENFQQRQVAILEENPFVEITDNKSYQLAKETRTALVRARTTIEKQDKLIASKISSFRKLVISKTKELIGITIEAENKQQAEVKRWEAIKAAEKAEKERLEQERKEKIKAKIEAFYNAELEKINTLTYADTQKKLLEIGGETDTSQFQEFKDEFEEKCKVLRELRGNRIISLKQEEEQRLERERIKKEREELERKRKEQEEAMRLEREAIEKLKKEAEEARLKIENEKRLKREAEERAEMERQEAEQAKIEEANRKKREEALRTDSEKIMNYVNSLKFVDTPPTIKDDNLRCMMKNFNNRANSLKEIFINEINIEVKK